MLSRRLAFVWLLVVLSLVAPASWAAEPFRYPEGRSGPAELKYLNGLPVLLVSGTPAEIGRQKAALLGAAVPRMAQYPQDLLRQIGRSDRWPQLLALGQTLLPQFPTSHLAELESFATAAPVDRKLLIGVNTLVDSYRGGLGCSSLIVEPERSATHSPLFGRNLDFFTLGWLQQYTLVTVHRPAGKHAFVSIDFPGMFGCLSGMNDAGLALATHEILVSGDGASLFDDHGTPYTLSYRRVLEECTTVEEAEQLLRSIPRTTLLALAVCDRTHSCVLEMTPKSVVRRDADRGLLACTNHFRTKELRAFGICWRYPKLVAAQQQPTLTLDDVAKKLDEVNMGPMTMQTMVFEPGPLKLHLAIGSCPSSALPLRELDLEPLFHPSTER